MNQTNNQELLTLDFGKDTVTYANQTFPTGTLACQALNIPQKVITELKELSVPLTNLLHSLENEPCHPELLEPARISAGEMLNLLQEQSPFCYLNVDLIQSTIDRLFCPEMLQLHRGLRTIDRKTNQDSIMMQAFLLNEQFERYLCVLEHLGYSLEQYRNAITEFAEHLDTLPDRSPEGLAEAVGQRFPNVLSLDETSWMSGMNQSSQYIVLPSGLIGRRLYYVSFVGMLRADLFEGLAVGHAPKKCKTCGRWFLTTNARKTRYCGGIDPNSPKGYTCRQVGNRKGRENREKAADHPLKRIYERRCNTINTAIRREQITPELGKEMKRLAKNHLHRAAKDNYYAQNFYATEMEQAALMTEARREAG